MSYFKLLSGKIAKATSQSGWYDIYSSQDIKIRPGIISRIPTGITTEMSSDLRAQICEKSGKAWAGLQCKGGCIDADYREEWFVMMTVLTPERLLFPYAEKKQAPLLKQLESRGYILIPAGTDVAQFKLEYIPQVAIDLGQGAIYLESDMTRTGGFGSTEEHLQKLNDVNNVLNYVKKCQSLGVQIESKDKELQSLCKEHLFTFSLLGRHDFTGTLHALIGEHGSCVITNIIFKQT